MTDDNDEVEIDMSPFNPDVEVCDNDYGQAADLALALGTMFEKTFFGLPAIQKHRETADAYVAVEDALAALYQAIGKAAYVGPPELPDERKAELHAAVMSVVTRVR